MNITKKFFTTAIIAATVIANVNCSPSDKRGEIETVDFEEIQRRALAFVHQIGTHGGEIVLSTISDPKSFNPITSTETSTTTFTALMYEGLMTRNGVTLEMEPNIAERYEVSDDGLTWTFFVRDGVVWSDGAPLTAYDVEFTFNQLIYNPDISPNSMRDILTLQDPQTGERHQIKVVALDSSQIQFTLPFPFAPFLESMSHEILPKHIFENAVRQGTFSTELSISTPPSSMVVNGPFVLDSYLSSQRVVFRRNPRYWKADADGNWLPYLDRVVFMVTADQNAEQLRFLQGEVDYFAAKGEDYPKLRRAQASANFSVHRLGPNTGANFIVFNQNLAVDPATGRTYVDSVKLRWFRNDNFRIAMAHLIDKENMVRIALNGLGYPQNSPKTPAEGFFYNGDVPTYEYNPARALEILEGEGFRRNANGMLEDADGNALEFSLITNSENNVRVRLAEIIRKDFSDVGIRVHFQVLQFNSVISKIDNPPFDWDAVVLGLTGGPEPHFGRNVWHSSGTLHMWYPRQSSPSTEWEARIDEIFDTAVRELDRYKRKELYDEWQVIAAQKQPLIYTVLSERIECIWNRFGNINPNMNTGLLHNLEYIYVLGDDRS